jgi:hypothetical protein
MASIVLFASPNFPFKILRTGDLLRQSVAGGGHTTRIPSEVGRDNRRAPFDMSDFPALAGRVSLTHVTPRDAY